MVYTEQVSLDQYFGASIFQMSRPILESVAKLAATNDKEARGAIYTRFEVVDFILDIAGYKPEQKLFDVTILEPSFGEGDFLLESQTKKFDYVIGNPPYLRQESIPEQLLKEYRLRYKTMFDRADIYIAFIEKALTLLNPNGILAFICSDRWMKNRYGGPLRNYISKGFNLEIYVDMVGTDAFQTEVSVYPAITVISRQKQGVTRVAHRPKVDNTVLGALSIALTSKKLLQSCSVKEMEGVVNGSEPWLLESADQLDLLRKIEAAYPTLEEAGCQIGIGVATGADKIFIQNYDKRGALINAAEDRDIDKCNKAVFKLYGLNQEERSVLGGNGE